jgi:hypothetical protein
MHGAGAPFAWLLTAAGPPLQAPPAPQGGQWQVHYTAEGRPYYYSPGTGVTQWDAPPGM